MGSRRQRLSPVLLFALGACGRPASPEQAAPAPPSESHAEAPVETQAAPARVEDEFLLALKRRGAFEPNGFFAASALAPAAPKVLAQIEDAAIPKPTHKGPSLVEPPEPPDATEADDPRCPQGMQLVEGESCWDVKHECTDPVPNDPALRCREFKKGADLCVPPKKNLKFCMDRYEWPGVPGAKPRVIVTYFEAERMCKSIGKRMCEEQEFYLACEGPEHWPFAWGHVRYPSTCNIDRPYTSVDWGKWGTRPYEEAKRLDQALPIGTSKCWSPYGIHDIAGNVDEWTHARPGRDLLGSLNGGYWGPVANACRYVTTVHGPEFAFYQIGFRCCADAKE